MAYDNVCGAKKRQGEGQCGRPAGWGTDHVGHGRCKFHGGATSAHRRAAARERAIAEVTRYGLPREVDPHSALLEELHRTAGHIAYIGAELADKTAAQVAASDLTALYVAERGHFARVAKTCVEVGIEERRVTLAEQQGALIAQVLRGVLTDLGVQDQPEVPNIVRKHLTLVAGQRAA